MESFSEKSMEDAIAKNPEKFINEKGLKLLARQFRIGSYVFDLLFEDQLRGKLIVEIQKGTLDRTHTYKILDYFHEYKEKNPKDYIDVMVIANEIPAERKRRLQDLGVAYQEIPPYEFINDQSEPPGIRRIFDDKQDTSAIENFKKETIPVKRHKLGTSYYIIMIQKIFKEVKNNNWNISEGNCSLILKHLPTTVYIEEKYGKGLKAQIWMERPNLNGKGRLKFEISGTITSMDKLKSDQIREKIAGELRSLMIKDLPEDFEEASGSTIIALRINLKDENDKNEHNIDHDDALKIIKFYKFLDEKLKEWYIKHGV